jgi:phenylpropionate dioxygenase-like ring-hydroxylating dioxygenase large terminal subunit
VRIGDLTAVLFRDGNGRFGLIQERCAHGGYPLMYAQPHATGIACARHGWNFDADGNCWVVGYKDKVYEMNWAHARTYPVWEDHGVLWTFLGEGDPPPPPRLSLDQVESIRAALAPGALDSSREQE